MSSVYQRFVIGPVGEKAVNSPDASAIASFRYRLREASRLALELGDKLLQLSQDAPEPNVSQLKEMREIENFLDCLVRYNIRDIQNKAIRS